MNRSARSAGILAGLPPSSSSPMHAPRTSGLSMIRERPERRHPCRLTARFIVPDARSSNVRGLSMNRSARSAGILAGLPPGSSSRCTLLERPALHDPGAPGAPASLPAYRPVHRPDARSSNVRALHDPGAPGAPASLPAYRSVHRPDARSSNVRALHEPERPERRHPCRLTAQFIVPMHPPRTSGLSMIRERPERRHPCRLTARFIVPRCTLLERPGSP